MITSRSKFRFVNELEMNANLIEFICFRNIHYIQEAVLYYRGDRGKMMNGVR